MIGDLRIMKNRKLLMGLFWVVGFFAMQGQQEPNFTMYNFNLNVINPAYVSVKEHAEASISYRSQWNGVPNAPNTSVLSYVSPITDDLGFGLSVVNDEVFIMNKTDASFDLSYGLRFSNDYYIHVGLKASASFVNLNLSEAGAPDSDGKFYENESYVTPTFGAGVYLLHPKYYVSLSTPNASKVERYREEPGSPDIVINYLHVYFGAGYILEFSKNFTLTPAIMSRFVSGATPSYDMSVTADYMDRIKGGVNYRIDESVSLYTLFSSKHNFKFGFSYAMNIAEIAKVNTDGSLELLLRYTWD